MSWSITPNDRLKHEALFHQYKQPDGFVPGNVGRDILMKSGLPLQTLGQIWFFFFLLFSVLFPPIIMI